MVSKKNIKKVLRKSTAVFMSISMLSSLAIFGSATSKDNNISNENKVSHESYLLEDLPKVIKDSVMSNKKTVQEISDVTPEDLYSVTVKNEDGSNTLSIFGQRIL